MKKSLIERSRPYLILIGFCCIAALPLISAGLFNRYPRIHWDRHLDEQISKYAPVGSSTSEAVQLMEWNGCECSSDSSEGEPVIVCLKTRWVLLGDFFYEISIYGPKVVKKIDIYVYH